jgi:ketosteroid isomerase-like protein
MQTMEMLVTDIREAMESADLDAMGELLTPDARWGAPEQDVPTCQNAKQILSWYEMARDNGMRADVIETVIIANHVVVGFKILAAREGTPTSGDSMRWQVLSVRDGRVAEIRGYATRREAAEFATTGVSNWRSS